MNPSSWKCSVFLLILLLTAQCAHQNEDIDTTIDRSITLDGLLLKSQQSSLAHFRSAYPERYSIGNDKDPYAATAYRDSGLQCMLSKREEYKNLYNGELRNQIRLLARNGASIDDYNNQRFKQLSLLRDTNTYLEMAVRYLVDRIHAEGRVNTIPYQLSVVKCTRLTRYCQFLNAEISSSYLKAPNREICIKFRYTYENIAKDEHLDYGTDEVLIKFLPTDKPESVTLSYSDTNDNRMAVNLPALSRSITSYLVNWLPTNNPAYLSVRDIYTQIVAANNVLESLYEEHRSRHEKLSNLIERTAKDDVYCYIQNKGIGIEYFMDIHDCRILSVSSKNFKNMPFMKFNLSYTNIFNNVNIKFNDQYKISRYLFDKIVRKGIRFFQDAFECIPVVGISFQVAATDMNFVTDNNRNVAIYEFYLTKDSISSYTNDDISGKVLADRSYIFYNKERIDLRSY